ncbi:4-demethylwyosine synthase TYW1 [Methanospirillum stamsii]|uniref:S-adenosyl-L-methionine-dependent tRNA 4-demethylwyosine synthase n=1 Tax=Methanospirillum stamsii TaxID=1277351 RepID=A0A2V2N6I3_9EURY|nr:4-demethylwyosine synthase TYW1 [Methanospirillum stamsii]PWR75682.1 4-demethylwyosine synthase TYW1 [Methanospirillum stamsii]
MPSEPCEPPEKVLRKMGYQFFHPDSSAALKPCLWCKRSLTGGDQCYKNQFYGITSHRCVQMTPTLRCNHKCLFCWRSFEHEYIGEKELSPADIVSKIPFLQKKALGGYKVSYRVTKEKWEEALRPDQYAISLSGEPTLYTHLPELIDLLNQTEGTTFLVSNGTMPGVLRNCHPYQKYISLTGPDRETYLKIARPDEDYWDRILESISDLGHETDAGNRTAIRVTLVKGINDQDPAGYARIIQESGAQFVEVKAYMHVGYSQRRLTIKHMPLHEEIEQFTKQMLPHLSYKVRGENTLSRVICLERDS